MDDKKPNEGTLDGQNEFQPDEAVVLRPTEPIQPAATAVVMPSPIPVLPPVPEAPVAASAAPISPYATHAGDADEPDAGPDEQYSIEPPEISWQALEFVHHPKTAKWYAIYSLASLVIVAVGYLIARDVVTVVVLVICAGMFGYVAARQPRELSYGLGHNGIYVGRRLYPYKDFNAFGIIDDGVVASIDFMPLKRFAPMLSIYCDPAEESDVMDILTQHLPYRNHQRTALDTLMHRIHF